MQHIVKIRNRRLRETPNKQTLFRIRHQPVDKVKIERFEQEHSIKSRLCSSNFQRFVTSGTTHSFKARPLRLVGAHQRLSRTLHQGISG